LFNTGVDENGQALPDGSVDPHYTLVVNADSGSTETFVQDSTVFPIVAGPWVANTATSKWIGPRVNTGAAAGLATGGGIYRYRITFDLTDLDMDAVTITGSWATDNEGLNIYVNGEPTGLVSNNQFASLTPFTINSANANLVEGLNTLEFELRNTDAVAGYTGLRVTDLRGLAPLPGTPPIITVEPQDEVAEIGGQARFSVTAEGSAPLSYQWWSNGTEIPDASDPSLVFTVSSTDDAGDYSVVVSNSFGSVTSVVARLTVFQPIPGVVNTGVDSSGAPLDDNTVDPHYILVTNAHDSASSEAIVHDSTVFPIVAGPWVPNSATSKWIGPVFNTVAAAGGVYVYRLTVDLSDRDPATVRIVGKWATDNPGTDIRVNGVSTGNPPSPGFTAYTSFSIDSSNAAFVSGLNTIDFVLENTSVGYTGLRVEDLKSDAVPLPPGTPPSISLQPQSRHARVSEDVTFTVAASGSGPLTYQWFFEGFELFEETSATLRLLSVTPDQAGSYQVVVAGPDDSVTSAPAILTIGPALELWITTYNRLRLGGVVGNTYVVEYADDPANPVFSTLTTIVLPSDPHFIVDPAVDAPNRIYRIVPQPE
jgi:hypothetical protein